MFIFKKEKDIVRQIEHFVERKSKRSVYAAQNSREWLLSFTEVSDAESIFDITEDDEKAFMEWVKERFSGSERCKINASNSLHSFLRFYKYDIM